MRNAFTKVAFAAAMILGMQLTAHASATALGTISGTETIKQVTENGSFSDTYTFTIDPSIYTAGSAAGFASTSVAFTTYGASVEGMALYVGDLTSAQLGGASAISTPTITISTPAGAAGATITTLANSSSLSTGVTYTLAIDGTSKDIAGYTADIVLVPLPVTPPVPEPESYAMLFAGLGMMGFIARRRQQRR